MAKVLNLYAGLGGNRMLWPKDYIVTAVELNKEIAKIYQSFYPQDTLIIGDAHNYLLNHYKDFDFIWSSPPCPSHSRIRYAGSLKQQYKPVFPDMKLYEEIIFLQHYLPGQSYFCVENVIPYYEPLINPSYKLAKHAIWCNFPIHKSTISPQKLHNTISSNTILYNTNLNDINIKNKRQLLRNMVDPVLGLFIIESAFNYHTSPVFNQLSLFHSIT